jgi:single-stranded DNA-binding protein
MTPNKSNSKRPSNWVVLTLQAAKDGESRYSSGGRPWASVRAFLSQGKDKDTDEYRPSLFFSVKAFGEDGEEPEGLVNNLGAIRKGDRFTVKGRLGLEQWIDDEGKERQSLVVFATDIQPFSFEDAAEELEGEPA